MLVKGVVVALVSVLLQGSLVAQTESQAPVQTPAKMQQLVRKAEAKNKAVKITFARKIDNQSKLTGKVSEVSGTGFTLTDQKTGKATKLSYEDVQQVREKGLSKGWKIGLGVVAGVVFAAVIVGETVLRDD